MKRIFITGNAGSGKTTLSCLLADKMNYERISLDGFVWLSGWNRVPQQEFRKNISSVLKKDTWIIEGVSSFVLQHADTVIFLDVPRRVSFYRVLKRNWRYLFTSRPGLPKNCPEIKIIFTLIKIIWQFPYVVKPTLLSQLEKYKYEKKFFHIKTSNELKGLYID